MARHLKGKTKYVTIKLPDGITNKIDDYLRDHDGEYTSRTDVIKTALRFFFREF